MTHFKCLLLGRCRRNEIGITYLERAAQRGREGGGGEKGGLQVEKLRPGQRTVPQFRMSSAVESKLAPSELSMSKPSSRYFMSSLNSPDNLRQEVPPPVYSEGYWAPRRVVGQGGVS